MPGWIWGFVHRWIYHTIPVETKFSPIQRLCFILHDQQNRVSTERAT